MDHRPEGRRPGRPHSIAPSPPAMTPFTMDALPTLSRTPLLVVPERVASDAHAVRNRALERRKLLRRMHVHVRDAPPATRRRHDIQHRQLTNVGATTGHRPSGLAPRPSPAAPPWVACDPTRARLLPGCDRDRPNRSQIGHFPCGAVRTPAQAFYLRRGAYRTPSHLSYRVEAGGIEPPSAVAPTERLRA